MASPFLGEICIYPFNFAPAGWAFCSGQLLPISQNTALFSLLGTNYGGDGKSTFGLPNLQGAAPNFYGQGPGLSQYIIGQTGGEETHTITNAEVPSHSHTATTIPSYSLNANLKAPSGNLPAFVQGTNTNIYTAPANANTTNTGMFNSPSGAHNNMQPYLVLNFCIALQGVFPARN